MVRFYRLTENLNSGRIGGHVGLPVENPMISRGLESLPPKIFVGFV